MMMLCTGCTNPVIQVSPIHVTSKPSDYQYPINDAHCHLVNFLQETQGAGRLLQAMDSANVEHIVVYGLPVTKKWNSFDETAPEYYTDNDSKVYYYGLTDSIVAREILGLPEARQSRFHPLICGFNPTDRFVMGCV